MSSRCTLQVLIPDPITDRILIAFHGPTRTWTLPAGDLLKGEDMAAAAHRIVADAVSVGVQIGWVTDIAIEPGGVRVLLPGWLRRASGGPAEAGSVTIDNDANLAALAERTHGAGRGINDFAYIHIGTGLGVGLVLNGQIYRGHQGAAGEVGYLPTGDTSPRTRSGKTSRGMLEEQLAADAVVRRAREAGMTGRLTSARVFELARSGNTVAQRVVAEEGRQLAHLLGAISAFVDPQLIVVGGGVGQNLDLLLPPAWEELNRLTPMQPRVVASELGPDAIVQGAIARSVTITRELVFKGAMDQAG